MSDEEYAYGHVLEALTGGLYPNKLDVLREYIQNSYDAIREYLRVTKNPSPCKIEVLVKAGSVTVHDNATGMNLATVGEYRKIGYSRKELGEYAGWRGIGKLAGLTVADKLIVTTSPVGIPEAYQLEFDSAQMLNVVKELRAKNENISLNQLIEKYSRLETIHEKKTEHYTTVELCKINSDSSELLNSSLIEAHLSQIAPVPFHPKFKLGRRIVENIVEHVDDYLPVSISVNGNKVFKPYRESWENEGRRISVKDPEFLPVYDETGELIAYAWYCMNRGKGQIDVNCSVSGQQVDVSGLIYRAHDIAIGDAQLTRRTLWRSTPERAFYSMGEIHILDPHIEPTADRNDFKDNFNRYRMYQACSKIISTEVNRKAGRQSAELRAKEKIEELYETIDQLNAKLRAKAIPKELLSLMIYKAHQAKEEVQKRRPYATRRTLKRKANRIVTLADNIIDRLTRESSTSVSGGLPTGVYDLTKELEFSQEVVLVYETILKVLRDFFLNQSAIYEELVRLVQEELRKVIGRQE